MYLRQKCPNCGTEKEFVYVQIGHNTCCKNCNTDFILTTKRVSLLPYVVWGVILLAAAGLAFFFLRQFHNWWIYR
jgi:hypothetical protein